MIPLARYFAPGRTNCWLAHWCSTAWHILLGPSWLMHGAAHPPLHTTGTAAWMQQHPPTTVRLAIYHACLYKHPVGSHLELLYIKSLARVSHWATIPSNIQCQLVSALAQNRHSNPTRLPVNTPLTLNCHTGGDNTVVIDTHTAHTQHSTLHPMKAAPETAKDQI